MSDRWTRRAPFVATTKKGIHRRRSDLFAGLYATFARRFGLIIFATRAMNLMANLKISDIDSSLMLIHVRQGKGSRDRELPLTQKMLGALREYWRATKIKPRVYLFPSPHGSAAEERPVSDKTVWHACHEAALRAGIGKRIGPHTLRHYAAS
jgi:integrase